MTDDAAKMAARRATERWSKLGPILLLLLTALAYLPSLGGGFLNWDDPWLLESNRSLQHPSLRVLWAIWGDFSLPTRLTFGAEYLPLRDTSHLIEAWLTGINPSTSAYRQPFHLPWRTGRGSSANAGRASK